MSFIYLRYTVIFCVVGHGILLVRTESSVITKKSLQRQILTNKTNFVRIIKYNSVCMTVLIYILSALTKKK